MFSGSIRVAVLIGSALASQSSGQDSVSDHKAGEDASRPPDFRLSDDHNKSASPPDNPGSPPAANDVGFIMSGIDEAVVREFRKAWSVAKAGVGQSEGLVLLYRKVDGSLLARSLGASNEYKKYSFSWNSAIIGIVHTHPNSADPKPVGDDLRIADRFRIPVFTITRRGMFVYDPATRKISRVRNDFDWMIPTAVLQASSGN